MAGDWSDVQNDPRLQERNWTKAKTTAGTKLSPPSVPLTPIRSYRAALTYSHMLPG